MLLKIDPQRPSSKHFNTTVDTLLNGGLVIYPTDTVYSIGCDMNDPEAVDHLLRVTGKASVKELSLIFHDLSNIADYTLPFDRSVYRLMKKSLPGPYTFILRANNKVPKIFNDNRKEIGIRVPDNKIPREIVRRLGNPMVTASIHDEDEILQYPTDPVAIHERFKDDVDVVIDGGNGDVEASTVFSCLDGEIRVIREGKGNLAVLE